ncbi:MAG: hypothetical protein I3J03_10235, partial [Actinomyces succiniciruminis]|nr:hypothetical protein [Actinomyces succiniciruminis]
MPFAFTGLIGSVLPLNATALPPAPRSPVLLFAVLIQPVALLVAYLAGRFASHLVRRRAQIS